MDDSFDAYSTEVEDATNQVNLKLSSTTTRRGSPKFRDRLVFGKIAWQESLSFVAIVQSLIIFMALIPQAVGTGNEFLKFIGIQYQFPIHIASVVVIFFIVFVFAFGMIAIRYIGTMRTANEISSKMNPGNYLLWKQLKDLEEKVVKLETQKDIDNRQ